VIRLQDTAGTAAGFHAQAGIFLEPSFPRPVFNLVTGTPHVVDAMDSLLPTEIGMRNTADFVAFPPGTPEGVTFEVRRIRRFHDVNGVIGRNLEPLRYAYEIRRGRFTGYSTTVKQYGLVTASGFTMDWESTKIPGSAPRAPDVWNDGGTYTGTNLGGFTDPNVNIHPGDLFRVLDYNGDLVDQAIISGVVDDATLRLEPPGITTTLFVGQRFEVYLRQAPVPHEQSNEQLLDLITDKKVCRTFADEANDLGGYVPTTEVNKLFDDLNAPGGGTDFTTRGVKRGDILLVDPLGTKTTTTNPETGAYHLGDRGILGRVWPGVAGGPTPLDDNRGWYRITSVVPEGASPPHLVVNPATTFTGTNGSDVTFPDDPTLSGDMGYAVYPTVRGSLLPGSGGIEGQMDLRPSEVAQGGTHTGDYYSIRPFGYRIIRPSSLFTDEAIDLVLCHRERILSMLQLLKGVLTGTRSGDYFIFQRDDHCHDLGNPTDFLDGVGVLTNAYIMSIIGEVDKSPYYNSASGLSILDRRFWILDRRLDSLVPDGVTGSRLYYPGTDPAYPTNLGPYTAFTVETGTSPGAAVRPVLPDRVGIVLDTGDRFRPTRYTWLSFRTHKVLGTLSAIDRFDAELPGRLEEQRKALDVTKSTEAAGNVLRIST